MKLIPYHLGLILDGNRRWAEERGLPAQEGHRRGSKKLEELIQWVKERGVKILTIFVFSTENWQRPKREVDFLFGLAKRMVNNSLEKLNRQKIKVRVIGQREKLPESLKTAITKAEKLTQNNQEMTLNFALSYGGRAEIVEAIKNIIQKKFSPDKITEEVISQNLWTSELDLLIRTGKEQRLSNFLIWQAAYSELYFSQKYWPDFTEKDLDEALQDFVQRQRRFGK